MSSKKSQNNKNGNLTFIRDEILSALELLEPTKKPAQPLQTTPNDNDPSYSGKNPKVQQWTQLQSTLEQIKIQLDDFAD